MCNPETFRCWLTETLDADQIEDLAGHGADAGWPGLTYTSECVELFERFEEEIREASWPADTDKMGHESTVPISPSVRAALDRIHADRPGIGAAPLFPSPGDPTQPMTRHLADKWLRKAEKLASVDPQKGSLWHAYRRKWATEKETPI